MICHVYDSVGTRLIGKVDAEPECGEDFCDRCGDCMHCNGDEDDCMGRDGHCWVIYYGPNEELPSFLRSFR